MPLPLVLGGISLFGFDAPEEFGPIGGKQVVVKHEFPGGLITQQEMGGFPEPIKWKGTLLGASAMTELMALDQIRASGQDTTLSWGPFQWLGKVTEFAGHAKHAFLIPYEITFEPAQDLGAGIVPKTGLPLSAQDNADLSASVTAITLMVSGLTDNALAFPASLVTPANALLDAVSVGLLNGDGTVAGLLPADVSAINSAAVTAQDAALAVMNGTDPADSCVACDFWSQASTIASIVPSSKSTVAQFVAVNPNLFQIAAQYYGDATLWILIAEASRITEGPQAGSLLPYDDPQPTGVFLITVPPAPSATGKCGCQTNAPSNYASY